jgi:hypothetical protein
MSSHTSPPPLPDPNSALRTYLGAVALLIPTIFFWLFAMTFLVPKLEQIWQLAGLNGSKAQWLMDVSYGLKQHFQFIVASVVVVLLLLEFRWSAWPRHRRAVVAGITLFFHTAVLLGITTIAVAVCLAAPLLTKHN